MSASDKSLDLFGKLRISKHLVDHFRFYESTSYALEPLFRLLWLRRAHFQIRQLREAPNYFLCHHAGQQRIKLKIALLLAIAILVQALFESRLKAAQHPLTDCAMKSFQRSRTIVFLTISALSWPLQLLKGQGYVVINDQRRTGLGQRKARSNEQVVLQTRREHKPCIRSNDLLPRPLLRTNGIGLPHFLFHRQYIQVLHPQLISTLIWICCFWLLLTAEAQWPDGSKGEARVLTGFLRLLFYLFVTLLTKYVVVQQRSSRFIHNEYRPHLSGCSLDGIFIP